MILVMVREFLSKIRAASCGLCLSFSSTLSGFFFTASSFIVPIPITIYQTARCFFFFLK